MLDQKIGNAISTTGRHLKKLDNLGIKTVRDLLFYFPRAYNDSSEFTKIAQISLNENNVIKGYIKQLFEIRSKFGKKIIKGKFFDDTGEIDVIWFNQSHLLKFLPRQKEIILSGKVKYSFGKLALQSPSYEIPQKSTALIHSGRIVPTYPETAGISSKWLREKLRPIIDMWLAQIEDYLPQEIITANSLMDLKSSILNVHFPENAEMLTKAKERLAFDELFSLQLKIMQKKWKWQKIQKHEEKKMDIIKADLEKCRQNLAFDLTNAQTRVLGEILGDLQKNYPMSRLIQGDVGSGKTIVAALSALNVVKNGYQVAVMAPTEILAKQHFQTFIQTLTSYGINVQFLAGSTTNKEKKDVLRQMQTGTVDIIIGTHALIQEDIKFQKLGLAIIDEQHRFGVRQRDILKSHNSPHLLCMTATPIPRTLAITLYGDQDLSIIDEMPQGRQKILTRVVPEKKRTQAYDWIRDQVKKGRQAFIICPLIDESDVLEVKSVIKEYDYLQNNIFVDEKLGLLHGKLKQEEKDRIMLDFKDNKIHILVSTSVIEVGIDVPNATIMLIEGSERFGLSQLHQFRGRVGRGEHQSYCFLFLGDSSKEATQRMKAMEIHASGFKLSEIDLQLRGPGEVYGLRQSGIPDLRMASLTDSIMIEKARKSAGKIIDNDPYLENYPKLAEKILEIEDIYIND